MHSQRRVSAVVLITLILATAGGAPALAQNLFVSFDHSDVIKSVSPDGSNANPFYTGTSGSRPLGLAFDAAGNLYVANAGSNSIQKITPTGTVSSFGAGVNLANPFDLAFDAAGNLYVANAGSGNIKKISPIGTDLGTFYTGTINSSPEGLAFDAAGNLYVANSGDNTIAKITPIGTVSTFYSGAGVSSPLGLAFDAAGNLYVANSNGYSIEKITPDRSASTFYSSPLSADGALEFKPNFLAFDNQGNLYATNNLNFQNFNNTSDNRFATVVKFSIDSTTGNPSNVSTFYSDSTAEHAYGLAFSGRYLPNSVGAAPEPSEWAALGFTGLCISVALVKARRRSLPRH